MNHQAPAIRTKLSFWLLLGLYSVAFAEVTCGNQPFALFTAEGYLIMLPVYGFHALVLGGLVVRYRRTSWQGLLFAGALFGLYEAYLTRVLFDPYFAREMGGEWLGIWWGHVVLLVTWWHPLMAFIVPLFVAETLGTSSRTLLGGWPPWIRRRLDTRAKRVLVLAGFALACALLSSTNGELGLGGLAVSTFGHVAVLVLVTTVYRRFGRGRHYPLEALMPGPRAMAIMAGLMGALFALFFFGPLLGKDGGNAFMPPVSAHLIIFAMYGLFALFLYWSPSRSLAGGALASRGPGYRGALWVFALVYPLAAVVFQPFIGPVAPVVHLLHWGLTLLVGLTAYFIAIFTTLAGPGSSGTGD